MKKILYALASVGIVLTVLSAENFVLPKKEIVKKKQRITEEHVIATEGDILQEIPIALKELAALLDDSVNNVRETMSQEKPNSCKNASQQERQQYVECTRKMQNAMSECSRCIVEQRSIRKRCFKK